MSNSEEGAVAWPTREKVAREIGAKMFPAFNWTVGAFCGAGAQTPEKARMLAAADAIRALYAAPSASAVREAINWQPIETIARFAIIEECARIAETELQNAIEMLSEQGFGIAAKIRALAEPRPDAESIPAPDPHTALMWIIVKFSLASGQMRYFGPFKNHDEAKKWGKNRWLRNENSWWGTTKLEMCH